MSPLSDRSAPGRSRASVPNVEPLEDRRLCSHVHGGSHIHAEAIFTVPTGPPTTLRTGGGAFALGSGVLLVVTNKPGNFPNEATISDDGAGNVTVEWNGHHPPTFHGITRIVFDGRGRHNTLTFNLTGNVTKPQELDVQLDGTHSAFDANLGSFQTNGLLKVEVQTAPLPRNPVVGP